ncbi:MAG: secretin N-terminal domain-containing protein [Cellvibrionaceae bacterium]
MKALLLAWSLCILTSLYANSVVADSYRQIELKHRDATSLAARLDGLKGERLSIVTEGNTLLLRGPSAEINQLVRIIKQLDKPRQQLKVSVYRGDTPNLEGKSRDKKGVTKKWSTYKEPSNSLDTAIIDDGSTLLITDRRLLVLPVDYRYQLGNTTESFEYSGNDTRITDNENSEYRSLYRQNSYEKHTDGIHLTATLLSGKKLSIKALFTSPQTSRSPSRSIYTPAETLPATKETSLSRTITEGEWINLSEHGQHANFIGLGSRTKVFSTRKNKESEGSIWAKVELINK